MKKKAEAHPSMVRNGPPINLSVKGNPTRSSTTLPIFFENGEGEAAPPLPLSPTGRISHSVGLLVPESREYERERHQNYQRLLATERRITMGFLGKMFGKKQSEVKASSITREQQPSGKANKAQNTAEDLIRALSYEDDKSAGATWSKRRDAAAKLGALGESAAVAPLYAGMNTAIDKMRQSHSKLNPKQLDCLLNWKLTVLPETHTEAEYDSLPERTGTALTIIYIGEFEWARATAIVHAEALAKLGEEKAAQQLVSELQKLQGAQPEQAEALLHPASTNKSSTEPSTPVKEEPAKRAWTPTIPRYASHMPLSDLQHIFIFTDGNGQAVLDSPVVIGMLQDTAEAPLKDFMGKVQFDIIARSNVASQIQQTGKIPESAWTAMSNIDSAITQKARVGTYRSVVRVSEDPRTKEQFVLVLIYRM